MRIQVDEGGVRRSIPAKAGQSLLDALQAAGVDVKAPCGGFGICGKCQVHVSDAEGTSMRLACTTRVSEGMEVAVAKAGAMEVIDSGMACTYDLDPGQQGFGMAVDIGTTTMAAHLHDLSTGRRLATVSRANPQATFGGDVISRISASVDGKLELMADAVQDALRAMLAELCDAAGVEGSQVVRCAIAGNTVMQHIACNLSPDSIGVAPFEPLTLFGDVHPIEGLPECYWAACIAGYVGGDITAGMLARGIDAGGTRLFLDLGTNGEMALAHDGRIVCCATAAGPVFEGANVRFGMPALPGAISKVRIADGQVQTQVIGAVEPTGVCGTGIIDAVAAMVDAGIVDETGYLLGAGELADSLAALVGEEDEGNVFYLDDAHRVYITQSDVRNLQLAKAAVAAGIQTMFAHVGIGPQDVEALEVAGGFGAYLDMQSAARIGLFPPQLLDRALSVGNAAAEGAAALLLSGQAREKQGDIIDACEYVELSTSSAFNGFYVDAMEFESAESVRL